MKICEMCDEEMDFSHERKRFCGSQSDKESCTYKQQLKKSNNYIRKDRIPKSKERYIDKDIDLASYGYLNG